jgi:hypothetical protein
MLKTFVLIFWLGQGAGSAEFEGLDACLKAHAALKEVYTHTYGGVCLPKGNDNDKIYGK